MNKAFQDLVINVAQIGKWLIEREYIWQMKLLDEEMFLKFAKDRGVNFGIFDHDVKLLRKFWNLGLIRADLVISVEPQEIEDLIFLTDKDSQYIYADNRKCSKRDNGYSNCLQEIEETTKNIKLLFHPFRLFNLFKILEEGQTNLSDLAVYGSSDKYIEFIAAHINSFGKFTSTERFHNRVAFWNDIVSLAVAAEPITFRKIFGYFTIRYSYPFESNEKNEQIFHNTIQTHKNEFKELLSKFNVDQIQEIVSEICIVVESIEPNSEVLTLLRLMKGKYRLERLKGKLGLAIYISTMAEVVRRSAELAFGITLPEEDELGFGWDTRSLKNYFFGSERLLDNQKAKVQFIRNLELDYNIRLRWYVEGQTEFVALQSLFGENNLSIEIINLKGEVVAGKGKGVAFRENLLNDTNRSIYSWVSLDKDISENCRVVTKAVEQGEMFGSYFFAKPDFEFENFTLNELVEITWEIAFENGANAEEKGKLIEATKSTKTGAEFEKAVRQSIPKLNTFGKGKEWGERLMKFANANRKMQMKDGSLKLRQICESIYLAHQAISCSYYLSRKDCKVDLTTGRLINNK